jgi:intracellular multiplication protein IcmB
MDASEDMKDLISLAIDEAYRRCTAAGGSSKIYRPGVEPQVDAALNRYGFCVDEESPSWRAAVIRLCELGEHSLAERAQRHAVPIFEDLLKSARADRVQEALDRLGSNDNSYAILRTFEDAIAGFIMRFPTLNAPSRLDFGQARIVVLDLHHVAPMGSAAADQQSALMFLLARHVLARNFFLHPDCLSYVPEGVRAYHEKRFLEGLDTVKRLDFNDWHRAGRSTAVVAQAERDLREARKHNVQLAFTCQRLQDVRGWVASEASGLFILGTGDRGNIEDLTRRFDLTELSAELVRERLTGPRQEGAPFLAIFRGEGCRNEQFLVNTLGPTEMWGLSATLTDSALRDRLYERIGVAETLRRLVIAFPNGSARAEIERRMSARLSRGDAIDQILNGVLSELENEVTGSSGLGLSSQPHVEEAGLKPSHSDVV